MAYNERKFLTPDSCSRSMACYHAKVEEDNKMKLTIHDCRGSIQLWNDLNNPEEIIEAMNKLESLEIGIRRLRNYINRKYT